MSEGDDRASEAGAESVSVDLTLIDEMLRMTPAERLRQNDRLKRLVAERDLEIEVMKEIAAKKW